jgi:8-oxo-dGTP pyrophosphatase MutT (NUDIX family)
MTAGTVAPLLRNWQPTTSQQAELQKEFLALAELPQATSRETAPAHFTASTLVMSADHSMMLLTLHAKANRWFQFGGHIDPSDTSLIAAAERELAEESGLSLRVWPQPIHLDIHEVAFCQPSTKIWHFDIRFLALAPVDATPRLSRESNAVQWWPLRSAPDLDLDSLINAAQAQLRSVS